MAKSLPSYSNAVILFADQYRTLAVYDKTKDTFNSFAMLDKNDPNANPKYYKISLNADVITITADPDLTGVNFNTDYSFSSNNKAADVWQVGDNIVIGMGDIRGLAAPKTDKFQLGNVDVYISSRATNTLRIGSKIKTFAPKKKKAAVKKTAKTVKKKSSAKKKR